MNIRKNIYNILCGQYFTEKSVKLVDKLKTTTFIVQNCANKHDVKFAVEKLFNVLVLSVRIINVKSKNIRFKNTVGKSKSFKKAMVMLKPGYDINFSKIN